MPAITCFIRYELDPTQREAFRTYAQAWGHIISRLVVGAFPRQPIAQQPAAQARNDVAPGLGGRLLGYWLPWEGTNDEAWGLVGFDSLAAYEAYRMRLKADPDAQANFKFAQSQRFIRREERTFCEDVQP